MTGHAKKTKSKQDMLSRWEGHIIIDLVKWTRNLSERNNPTSKLHAHKYQSISHWELCPLIPGLRHTSDSTLKYSLSVEHV